MVEKEGGEGNGGRVVSFVVVTVSKFNSITLLDSAGFCELVDGDGVFEGGDGDDSCPEGVVSADGWTSADDVSSVGTENKSKPIYPCAQQK